MTNLDKLNAAMGLLDRAMELLCDAPVTNDPNLWRDYYAFTGEHVILTDEGWDSGDNKQAYIEQAERDGIPLSDLILGELNTPLAVPALPRRRKRETYC